MLEDDRRATLEPASRDGIAELDRKVKARLHIGQHQHVVAIDLLEQLGGTVGNGQHGVGMCMINEAMGNNRMHNRLDRRVCGP